MKTIARKSRAFWAVLCAFVLGMTGLSQAALVTVDSQTGMPTFDPTYVTSWASTLVIAIIGAVVVVSLLGLGWRMISKWLGLGRKGH